MFSPNEAASRFDRLVDIVLDRHGPRAASLRQVFEHQDMLDEILTRRNYVSDPDHRFFMALLLNVDRRPQIFALIKHRFPAADPVEKILDWVFDLAETRVMGIDSSNALGIREFGDTEMFVLEGILRDKTDEEIRQEFSSGAGGTGSTINDAIMTVRNAIIFRPLLVS